MRVVLRVVVRYLELADEGVFDERELSRRLFLGNVRQRKARRGQRYLPQLMAAKKKKKKEEDHHHQRALKQVKRKKEKEEKSALGLGGERLTASIMSDELRRLSLAASCLVWNWL